MFRRELFGAGADDARGADVRDTRGAYLVKHKLSENQVAVLVDLTQQVFNAVERELKLTGFWESIPARNKLRAELLKLVVSPQFNGLPNSVARRAAIISRVLEIAKRDNDAILFAT